MVRKKRTLYVPIIYISCKRICFRNDVRTEERRGEFGSNEDSGH